MRKDKLKRVYDSYVILAEQLVGDGGTLTKDLDEAGKLLIGEAFEGVFASDQIPQNATWKCLIANLDPSDKPGSHWIAMARNPYKKGNGVIVYDSFGRDANVLLPEVALSMKNTEQDAEQCKQEDNCGARCLAWLLLFCHFGEEAALTI